MRFAIYAVVSYWNETAVLWSVFLLPLFRTGKVCGGKKKKKKKIKGETTLDRMREDNLSFGCSFMLFFILSEPVVPPLITTVLRHSWVWSLEILKWAKFFSYVIHLRCVSADHFKWSSMVLTASSPASDPVFAAALAQKGSRHSIYTEPESLSAQQRAMFSQPQLRCSDKAFWL